LEIAKVKPKNAKNGDRVFANGIPRNRRFRKDLAKAGISYEDALGRKADFHALRYFFATHLTRVGVPQRFTQELLRHSDPKLTAMVYTDTSLLPLYEAVKCLPWLGQSDHNDHASTTDNSQIAPQNLDADSQNDSFPVNLSVALNDTEAPENQQQRQEPTPPDTNCQMVGATGFEPATSCSQSRRTNQAVLRPVIHTQFKGK